MWLIPKTAKSAQRSDISIEFVHLDCCTTEQREELESRIVATRTVLAPKEVDIWDRFKLSRSDLAIALNLTGPKVGALIAELRIKDDPECFRLLARKKTTFPSYSQDALEKIRQALDSGLDVDDVWKRQRPNKNIQRAV